MKVTFSVRNVNRDFKGPLRRHRKRLLMNTRKFKKKKVYKN